MSKDTDGVRDPDWPVPVPESEWTPFQRAFMHADKIGGIRLNQQARLLQWAKRQRRVGGWISFNEIADWCARVPGGVARDEGRRAQAWNDLAQSIVAGEFARRTKASWSRLCIAYVPPQRMISPEPVHFRLRASDLGNGALRYCWAPQAIWRRWFAARSDIMPPPWLPHEESPAAPQVAGEQAAAEPSAELLPFEDRRARSLLVAEKVNGRWKERPTEAAARRFLKLHFRGIPNDRFRKILREVWPGEIRRGRRQRKSVAK